MLEMSKSMQNVEQKPRKERPIGKRLKQAVDLLLDGSCKSQRAVCERLNLSPSYLSRSLKSDRIRAFLARRTAETIAAGVLPATATVLRLVESAKSEHVQLDAAKHLMALSGYSPARDGASVTINAGGSVGYVIMLAGNDAEVLEGNIGQAGGVLLGRKMTPHERSNGITETSREMIDVTPERVK
ncbi:hypothetical protein AB8A20_08115 [Tardiphaga sp. 604_B6_N1_1]|uniref:hypothetical protein n=1 Tax=unclassified Tardiphaga TaxID=2631404 RepID=UPI003F268117